MKPAFPVTRTLSAASPEADPTIDPDDRLDDQTHDYHGRRWNMIVSKESPVWPDRVVCDRTIASGEPACATSTEPAAVAHTIGNPHPMTKRAS
jgi:hypothetical protein